MIAIEKGMRFNSRKTLKGSHTWTEALRDHVIQIVSSYLTRKQAKGEKDERKSYQVTTKTTIAIIIIQEEQVEQNNIITRKQDTDRGKHQSSECARKEREKKRGAVWLIIQGRRRNGLIEASSVILSHGRKRHAQASRMMESVQCQVNGDPRHPTRLEGQGSVGREGMGRIKGKKKPVANSFLGGWRGGHQWWGDGGV